MIRNPIIFRGALSQISPRYSLALVTEFFYRGKRFALAVTRCRAINWREDRSTLESHFRLGFIIPTMNRLEPLNRLLRSIYSQTILPESLIVVDGSDEPLERNLVRHPDVELIYVREFPPSLTKQRNAGIQNIPAGLSHIGFLDDDLEFVPGSLDNLRSYILGQGGELGGVSFQIIGNPVPGPFHFLLTMMGQSSSTPGKVCKSGFAVGDLGACETYNSQWLCGGATVWRREVLEQFKFDEWFKGYALWEDVDFSFRVSQHYKLAVLTDAKVHHWHQGVDSPERALRIGDLEMVDRFYFVQKFPGQLSYPAAVWAGMWVVARNFRLAVLGWDRIFLFRTYSNIRALIRCSFGRVERFF